jgi:ribonuclease E
MGKISRFGLMELSRQRLRPSLSEGSHVTCPRCNGTGHIRDTESSALQVLRIIQEEAMKENSAAIHVQAPVDVAAFLLNEKRGEILKIETRHRVGIILIPNKHLETPHYKLERLKHDDPRLEETQASYAMAEQADTDIGYSKTQKEEGKPRQEAVVKGITPDQPAPIVERKPVEARPTAVAAAASPAETGFLGKIFGFFFSKPAAPVATPAATAEAKGPQQRGDRAGDRNNRGQRGRNRGGRNRDGSAQETRDDNAKKPLVEALEAKTQQARPPRPPREPKEQREPREASESKAETRNEGRRERSERPPRAPREERKENLSEIKVDETLLKGGVVAAAGVAVSSITETAEPAQTDSGRVEAKAGEDEEPRRRRRRGGRNRNRRDRDGAEGTTEGSSDDIEAGETTASSDVAETGDDAVAPAAAIVPVQAEAAAPASDSVPMMASSVPMTQPTAQETEAPAVEAAPAPTVLSNAIAAPLVPQQIARQEETVAEAAPVAEPAPEPVVAAPVVAAPVVALTEPEPVAVPVAIVPEPAVPEVAPAIVASQPAAEPLIETPAPLAPAAPVAAPAVAETAAPAAEAPAVIKTAVSSGSPKVEDLQSVLAAAGLTLAATDPNKLRAAQEATANIVAAPRVPRERKPLPAQSSEPLVQVETQRPQ